MHVNLTKNNRIFFKIKGTRFINENEYEYLNMTNIKLNWQDPTGETSPISTLIREEKFYIFFTYTSNAPRPKIKLHWAARKWMGPLLEFNQCHSIPFS